MALSRKEILPKEGETPEKSLGEMLRRAREEQNLDYVQLSEMTKLRPHILESLENEEWHRFSAPVFIKGFLRSYARALNLDMGAVLRLYDEKNPEVDSVPRPLSSLAPPRKRTPAFFVILVLLAGCAFFALHYYTSKRDTGQQLHVVKQPENIVPPGPEQIEKPAKSTSEPTEVTESSPKTVQERLKLEKEVRMRDEQTGPAAVQAEGPVSEITTPQPPQQETAKPLREAPKPAGKKPMTLKAEVKEKTWVKIILDQEDPKEYIFRPGSHPEWKAQDGFELFIGNAGGIALEFNGRKLDNLGGHGKVIHLKLPQKDERNARE